MAHHLTLSTASQDARDESTHLRLASTLVWRHRLILTGKLDYRSAAELEEEVDCLCQEGVTNLTLDLRQLAAIDPTGATVVAFCGAACRSRGREFAVIAGSPLIHRTLTEAGATALLTLDASESAVSHPSRSDGSYSERSTAIVKNL